jgi:tripartite-type tricarboxylate transporter receptor subunit TctC
MMNKRDLLRLLLSSAVVPLPLAARAQDAYPSRPVRILCGFPAGTSADIIARIYAQRLTDHFKQPFTVENRLGFGGNLAAQAAVKAPPDGYTLLLSTAANSISQAVYTNLGFDFGQDFRGVARLASAPNVLVVGPSINVKTIQEFVQLARQQPGKLSFGSAGVGTVPHLSGELFNLMTGAKMVHVPYKGNAQGLVDLADGRLSAIFAPAPTLAGFLKDNRIKALAVTTAKRTALLPDLPTLAESGLAGFDTAIWYGFSAPKGTPDAVVNALATAMLRATDTPEVRTSLATNGAEPVPAGPQEFAPYIAEDLQKWARVAKFANVKAE